MSNVAVSVHILCNHFSGAMIILITQGGGGKNWSIVDYVICVRSLIHSDDNALAIQYGLNCV